jgi:membrane protein YqaA with SNARE-associated domain
VINPEWLLEYGVAGLFIAAFLAATVLPLSSEFMLGALVTNGVDPVLVVSVATLGNVLGSLTCYALGWWGSQTLLQRWLRVADADLARARQHYAKYGRGSLLFAWLPIVGDPLTVVAGMMRTKLCIFLLLVTIGKLGRYLLVVAVL